VQTLARDRQGAIVTNRVLASILGGFNEQINCTTCISAFGSVGSFSAGAHGRKAISDDLSVIGGVAYAKYRSGGVDVSTPIAAGSLRYDFTELGISRPYVEAGGVLAPSGRVKAAVFLGRLTNLAVGPVSTVTLDRFVFAGDSTYQQVTVNLVRGAFRFSTGSSDKRAYATRRWRRSGCAAPSSIFSPNAPAPS
jgi:hypothetical protein